MQQNTSFQKGLDKMSKVVYSLMFGLHDYVGHIYQYHCSISKVCKINSWKHIGLVPKDCKIDVPSSWEKVLAKGGWENKSLKQNLASTWKNFLFFKKFLKNKNSNDVLFIENFSLYNVLSIILALLFARPSCQFWILHRFVFPKYGIKTILYKAFHRMIKLRVGKNQLVLLTDSDLLAKEQSSLFKTEVTVVPIPHTKASDSTKNNSEEVSIWWPGGSTRWDKGLDYINMLSKELQLARGMKLFVANSAQGKIFDSENVIYLPTSLSTEEYYKLMKSVNLILLPYIPSEYKLRTSGIFVEAIASGAKVITFKNTWMAHELGKYNLDKYLAIDLEEFSLDRVMQVAKLNLEDKLDFMKSEYTAFHSEISLANVIKNLNFKHF